MTESLKEHVKILTPIKYERTAKNQNQIDTIITGCTFDGINTVGIICHYINANQQTYEH